MTAIGRGLLAGAFGTLALDAVTYLDMALTGRPASDAPGETVRRTTRAAGLDLPDGDARTEAYGALGGLATGVGVGVVASLARSAGVRLPAPVGAVAIGGLAMAATDGPMAAGGVADPRDWTAQDWTRDVVPHLAYGLGVRWAMDRIDARADARAATVVAVTPEPARRGPSRVGVVLRSAVLGLATGGRSTLALAGPAVAAGGGRVAGLAGLLTAAEVVADKLPGVPSRLQPGPLGGRAASGAVGGAILARRSEVGAVAGTLAVAAGTAGAVAGSVLGAAWREVAAERGWTWQAAVAEDAVALALTAAACR